jgi:paraquat-inducible protein A
MTLGLHAGRSQRAWPPPSDGERLAGCGACGSVQRVQAVQGAQRLHCVRCDSTLVHSRGCNADAALAFASAGTLMLVAANLLPFLSTTVFGATRHSHLISSASAMYGDGYPELACVVALFVVVLPPLRMALLTIVLAALRFGRRPPWLGPAFRCANTLQTWAMADVFLLGLVVACARLRTQVSVGVESGALCFAAGAVLTLLTRAALDKADVWRAIAPAPQPPPDAAALTLAAALLYLPANLYPMATLPIGLTPTQYTVLQGVIDLSRAHLPGLALLVLCASFVIPLAKLAALAWCIASVLRRSTRHLAAKTRVFRIVEEIGRWSMVDPFVIACFVPVTQYNALIHGSAEAAAPAFTAVVILTTLAARSFDARLMWDAARARPQP